MGTFSDDEVALMAYTKLFPHQNKLTSLHVIRQHPSDEMPMVNGHGSTTEHKKQQEWM